jgi:Tfp pilus assembly protein PilF
VLALAMILAAFSYHQTLYWHDTITLFERAREVTPPSRELHLALGLGYLRARRMEEAERELAATVAADEYCADKHLELALAYKLDNQPKRALLEAQKGAELAPDEFDACKLYGLLLMQVGQYGPAALQLQKAATKRPGDTQVQAALREVQLESPQGGS